MNKIFKRARKDLSSTRKFSNLKRIEFLQKKKFEHFNAYSTLEKLKKMEKPSIYYFSCTDQTEMLGFNDFLFVDLEKI
ncbi:hypothetical protein BpHYR1_050275 [Brachionus plicatilis]|uniref:Uncharacterized protein n=1 Tax=Brachionus plicatilis TaxID=10195 RepID=A0A3M7QR82_BRAPC|nr:hypothetical protein BpHYR1_050275 [Brachionus plicatilis]